jgi:hypothetical protein
MRASTKNNRQNFAEEKQDSGRREACDKEGKKKNVELTDY